MSGFRFQTLRNKVIGFMIGYKSDLDLDEKAFVNNTQFVHITTKTATRMITQRKFNNVAELVIKDPMGFSPVLFSSVSNQKLLTVTLENAIETCEYDYRNKSDVLYHYFNGVKLVQITDHDKLISIVKKWYDLAKYEVNNEIGYTFLN